MRSIFFMCSALLLLVSCKQETLDVNKLQPKESQPLISFDRDQPHQYIIDVLGCGAQCPMYQLTVSSSGQAIYKGIMAVKQKTRQSFNMASSDLDKLNALYHDVDFFKLLSPEKVKCRQQTSDSAVIRISLLQNNGQWSRRLLAACDRQDYKKILKTLEPWTQHWVSGTANH